VTHPTSDVAWVSATSEVGWPPDLPCTGHGPPAGARAFHRRERDMSRASSVKGKGLCLLVPQSIISFLFMELGLSAISRGMRLCPAWQISFL
jgi:hypothetical protein